MDIFDQASEREDRDRETSILIARSKKRAYVFTGFCQNSRCGEEIQAGRFCDAWCRDEYSALENMKRIEGKRE